MDVQLGLSFDTSKLAESSFDESDRRIVTCNLLRCHPQLGDLFEELRQLKEGDLKLTFFRSPPFARQDRNVRFFGAHTASVKITRDW